jgi:acyl carrier protein
MKTKEKILEELTPIFRSVLNRPELVLKFEYSAADIDAWDSLNHAILIGEVRKYFNVNFKLKDVLALKTVSDLCNLLIRNKV